MSRKALRIVLQAALSAAALAFVLSRTDLGEVGRLVMGARAWVFPAVFALCILDRWVMAFKWRLLVQTKGAAPSMRDVFRVYYFGTFVGAFLPFSVAGDLVRGVWMFRDGHDGHDVASSIAIERVLGVASSACMAAGCALVLQVGMGVRVTPLLWLSGALLAGVAVCLTGAFIPSLSTWLPGSNLAPVRLFRTFHASLSAYRNHPGVLVLFFCLTIAEQCLPVAVHIVIAWAMGMAVPLYVFLLAVPLAQFVARVPLSYNGIGVMEGVLAYVFARMSLSQDQAVAVALVAEVLGMVALVPAVFVSWRRPVVTQEEATCRTH